MNDKQRAALSAALKAFCKDRKASAKQTEARDAFIEACAAAHEAGISDQELANAFRAKSPDEALSRARIQQLRTKGKKT